MVAVLVIKGLHNDDSGFRESLTSFFQGRSLKSVVFPTAAHDYPSSGYSFGCSHSFIRFEYSICTS